MIGSATSCPFSFQQIDEDDFVYVEADDQTAAGAEDTSKEERLILIADAACFKAIETQIAASGQASAAHPLWDGTKKVLAGGLFLLDLGARTGLKATKVAAIIGSLSLATVSTTTVIGCYVLTSTAVGAHYLEKVGDGVATGSHYSCKKLGSSEETATSVARVLRVVTVGGALVWAGTHTQTLASILFKSGTALSGRIFNFICPSSNS